MQPRLMRAAWSAPTGSFSILVRIDPHAADSPAYLAATYITFQYPRADRPSCSSRRLLLYPPAVNLSVSSCGSTLMQPRLRFAVSARNNHSFSILVRIDPHAAPRALFERWHQLHDFQYPRADRPSCSTPLRLPAPEQQQAFSILLRIDPHAAYSHIWTARRSQAFQYPRADRPSCSDDIPEAVLIVIHLSLASCGAAPMQPWSVLVPCAVTHTAFSILVRIDPHAAQVLAA